MKYLHPPLKTMKLTQPFGVDFVGNNGPDGQSYADLGLHDGHNGWDLSAAIGTTVYAVMDGTVKLRPAKTGYGNSLRIVTKTREVVNGHLSAFYAKEGQEVKAGDKVALTGNTGWSTGPHLHLGLRYLDFGNGVHDYDNGYYGYVDLKPLFAPDVFALPVDKKYGEKSPNINMLRWHFVFWDFWRAAGRFMTKREANALMYGYWSLREVLDPIMFQTWTMMHKPEYLNRLK